MASKNISRDDLLILLSSIGIVLGKDNKLPVEELNNRLGQALDTSQEFSDVIEKTPVDPLSLPKWSSKEQTLYQASQRGNMTEAFVGSMSAKKGNSSSKEETFKEMRQSILSIAYTIDLGIKEISFMDADDKWGIFVRIIDVFRLKDDVPLTYIIYKELAPTSDMPMDALRRQIRLEQDDVTSRISDLERCTLLRLLEKNTKRLDPKYHEIASTKEMKRLGFRPSFLLPLCPINMRNLGSLAKDSGCEVCGKKNTSRCVQCMSVVYCSKECQRSDWKTHKLACKSIKGGTWHTITVSDSSFGMPDMPYMSLLNRLDSMHKHPPTEVGSAITKAPPDVHDGKIFLAKFQISLGNPIGQATNMLVYDRTQRFKVFWTRNSDPNLFDEAQRIIGGKMKFYRWMKRISDYKYELCLDRAPEQDPLW
ncbi:hypothetical protein CVT25_009536 [Psilocybe cyanescens]|uniref:MYND-type domain-containing protein n=1 Tax=Psilocybe cyanescens TaxID=93625 RepID=A0A409XVF8_PSICY|nr:hypothetical protein CVT25_009536 [Psilocybe cyanescens]